jgi:cell division protein FtsW
MQRSCLFLIVTVALIFAIGLLMVFETSAAEILDKDLKASTHQAVFRQLLYGCLGICVAVAIWFVGYQTVLKLSFPTLIFFTLLLLMVFIPGIGHQRNGSYRWLGLGSMTMQPSEFAKLWVAIFSIHYLSRTERTLRRFLKAILIVAVPIFLILIEPDNGAAAMVGLLVLVSLYVTRVPLKYWLIPMAVLGIIGSCIALQMPYVTKRIEVYLHPELDLLGKGHQPYQAKIAAGSGGAFGLGLGKSMQKLTYLPEAQNDYIGAIFAEEFGFVGILVLLFLYMVVIVLGFMIASKASTSQGKGLAMIITFLLSFEAFVNLGVVSGLVPSTGLNLPFFSQGGTSLLVNMIALTLLLNIGWRSEQEKEREDARVMQTCAQIKAAL